MSKIKSAHKGFTLVELMVALTLLAILLPAIYSAFGAELDFLGKTAATAEKEQIINMVLATMAQDIHAASEILPSSSSSSLLLAIKNYTIEYQLKDHKVLRKKGSTSNYLTVEDGVSSLTFSYPLSHLVEIQADHATVKCYARN